MLCAIWHHLYNLKKKKNTHGRVLCSSKNVFHVFWIVEIISNWAMPSPDDTKVVTVQYDRFFLYTPRNDLYLNSRDTWFYRFDGCFRDLLKTLKKQLDFHLLLWFINETVLCESPISNFSKILHVSLVA